MSTSLNRRWATFVGGSLLACALIAAALILTERWQRPRDQDNVADSAKEVDRILRFDELNFCFRPPESDWSRIDAKRMRPDATLAFARQKPEMAFLIQAEAPGVERHADLATLMDIALTNHRSLWEGVEVQESRPLPLDGVAGERMTIALSGPRGKLTYVSWIGMHAGYVFQLHVFSPQAGADRLSAAADELFSRFSLIDPARVAHGGKPIEDFESPRHGYRWRLAGTRWQPWENLADVLPDAECGAMIGNYARAAVIPVSLLGRTPRLESLTTALIARLGMTFSPNQARGFQSVPGLAGQRFEMTRDVSGRTYVYRMQVIEHAGRGYLVAAWADTSAPDGTVQNLVDLLDRFELSGSIRPAPVKPAELTFEQKQTHAQVFNDLGRYHFNARLFHDSVDYFRQAFELLENDPVLLVNLVNAYVELSRFDEARDYLEKHLGRFPEHRELQARHAFVQAGAGDIEGAIKTYVSLFSTDYRDDEALAKYIELLTSRNRDDEALAQVAHYQKSGSSFLARRLEAMLYARRGDHTRSIATLNDLYKAEPFDAEVAYDLADECLAGGVPHEGLAVCRELINRRFDTAYAYLLKGRLELELKWYAAAKNSLEAALRKDPSNKTVREHLDQVSAMLGEGDNSMVKEPIALVPLPSQLAQVPPSPDTEALGRQYGAYYVDRSLAISFVAGQEYKTTTRQVVKLFDAAAVTRFSTFQLDFYPLAEQLYVNTLRVNDADGKEIAQGNPNDFYVVDDTAGGVASGRKLLGVPVPGLKPGCTVEMVFTRRDVVPPDRFPFAEHFFMADVPLLRDSVFVHAPPEITLAHSSAGLSPLAVEGGQLWSVERPPVYRYEPMQAPLDTFIPHLSLGAANGDWDELAGEYFGAITDRLAIESSMRTLADQTAPRNLAEEERALRLARLVRDQLTYKAIEFGRRARIPNKASTIVANRYGDCKDHSLLLVQLLQASDIEAHLALVRTDAAVDESLPSLDQFDHMIVYAPQLGGGRFFDCTDKQAPLDGTPPPGLASRSALVLDPAKPRFVALPPYSQDKNRALLEQSIKLVDEDDLLIDETLRLEGHVAATLRGLLKDIQPANRNAALQAQLSAVSGGAVQVQKVEIENLDDASAPLTLKMECRVRDKFSRVGDSLIGQVPALWERFLLRAQRMEKRHTPFMARYPLRIKSGITLGLPPGYSVGDMSLLHKQEQTQFAEWRVTAAQTNDAVRMEFEASRAAGKYSPEQYAAYCDTMDQTVGAVAQNIVLKRK